MNLLLLLPEDFLADGTVCLTGRRLEHARTVLRASEGRVLRVGRLGGMTGEGRVLEISEDALRLSVTLDSPPPPRPGVDLLLAVPRPKVVKRVLAAAASLGVDRIVLINAFRVEPYYFDAHALAPETVEEHLRLGLEQARDTRLPEVLVRRRFRPFVEDELDTVFGRGERIVLHPTADGSLDGAPAGAPRDSDRVVVAIGPEGGFIPFEVGLLAERGFVAHSLGARTLRVEVVIPYILGALSRRTRARGAGNE